MCSKIYVYAHITLGCRKFSYMKNYLLQKFTGKVSFALGRLWGLTILRAKFSLILFLSLLPNLLNLTQIHELNFYF